MRPLRAKPCRLLARLALALGVVAAALSCYGPTEVRLEVLTDLTCATETPRAAIVVGGAPIGETADGDCRLLAAGVTTLGDLVLTPGSRSERGSTVAVTVRVSTRGGDPKACAPGMANCVVTTRKFTYRAHEQRRVPIRVYRACIAKDCGDGACVEDAAGQSACVADNECTTDDCVLAGERPPVEAPPPAEAGSDAALDAALDAAKPVVCVGPGGDGIVASGFTLGAATPRLSVAMDRVYWLSGDELRYYDRTLRTTNAGPDGLTYEAVALAGDVPWFVRRPMGGGHEVVAGAGGGVTTLGGSFGPTSALVVAAGGVAYVADASNIQSLTAGAPSATSFYSQGGADELAATASRLFALKSGALGWLSRSSGNQMQTLAPTGATAVVADANAAYAWVAAGQDTELFAVTGGSLTPLVPAVKGGSLLALDSEALYWVDTGTRRIKRRPPTGGLPSFGGVQAPLDEEVKAIAVDPTPGGCVYFVTQPGGGLATLRVANKPGIVQVTVDAAPY